MLSAVSISILTEQKMLTASCQVVSLISLPRELPSTVLFAAVTTGCC